MMHREKRNEERSKSPTELENSKDTQHLDTYVINSLVGMEFNVTEVLM